jgi:hypothetical protein
VRSSETTITTNKEDGNPGSVLETRKMMVITTHPPPPTETTSLLLAIVMSKPAAADTLELSAEDTADLAEVMDTPQATKSLEDHTTLTVNTETPDTDMARPLAIAMSTTNRRLALMVEIATTRGLVVPRRPAVATDSAANVTIPAADTLVASTRIRADTRLPVIIPLVGIHPTSIKPADTKLPETTLPADTLLPEITLRAVATDSAENEIILLLAAATETIIPLAVVMDTALNVTLLARTLVLMVASASTPADRTNHPRTVIKHAR